MRLVIVLTYVHLAGLEERQIVSLILPYLNITNLLLQIGLLFIVIKIFYKRITIIKIKKLSKNNSSLSQIKKKVLFYRKYNYISKIVSKIDFKFYSIVLQLTKKLMNILVILFNTIFFNIRYKFYSNLM